MISIIICTANPDKIADIELNIKDTIGIGYELIVINNSKFEYNIFQAYNLGVEKSNFPLLCFMHDDIVYHSKNWGNEVINHFQSPDTGMIGISGTRYLSPVPSIWWAGGEKYSDSENGTLCINCIQTSIQHPGKNKYSKIMPLNSPGIQVAVLDGLWFCIPKKMFRLIRFDDNTFSGFHFYDLDISMQIHDSGYKIFCVYNIIVEHISDSNTDMNWLKACMAFYHKWKNHLPVSIIRIPFLQKVYIYFIAYKLLIYIHFINKVQIPSLKFVSNKFFSLQPK